MGQVTVGPPEPIARNQPLIFMADLALQKANITVPAPSPGAETANTFEMVRHFIWDRTIEDNPLELDLEFSDQEIGHARQYAAMMFNSIPPFVVTVQANSIPTNWEYPFLLATVYHLLLAKLMALSRKDLDYSAGNMTVDLTKRRIEFLSKWAPAFKTEATTIIKEHKIAANLESAYGSVC